ASDWLGDGRKEGLRERRRAKSESDDDLEQVAAIQRKIKTPVITSVKDACRWIDLPVDRKSATVSISMCFLEAKKFQRGWFLTVVDYKRSSNFADAERLLESLPFVLRKKMLLSVVLYVVPYNCKKPPAIPDITFNEGSILHFKHVTGLKIDKASGIPNGNVSSMGRVSEELVASSDDSGEATRAVEASDIKAAEHAWDPNKSSRANAEQICTLSGMVQAVQVSCIGETEANCAHGDNTQAAQTSVTGRLNQGNEQARVIVSENECIPELISTNHVPRPGTKRSSTGNGKENRKIKRAK
ncbi:hypothetical protein L914_02553, partial [Phytophthora nicotianae]